ncbi:hypothetical protein PG2019B_0252 [Bifidobacterium pseudolongum subsp. globosum]|nr:hypothetical protein PG2019B_0252 [Bifidobacterium pseudolongum subsp. globosum]
MKHGSDRGPTISVKPRLFAAFTAVAMMFATAVPALMPRTAQAANTYQDVGGACKPSTGSIGDLNATGTEDKGVATWVGRDMYIGDKPVAQDAEVALTGTMTNGLKPAGSYAVEAEGLTLVKGKLAINQVKNSWEYGGNSPGFRFGAVGFGGNYRPADGNTALAVAGQGSLITNMRPNPSNSYTYAGETVGAWTHGGWVGSAIVDNEPSGPYFTASLAGPSSWWISKPTNWNTSIMRNQNEFSPNGNVVNEYGYWGKTAPFNLTYKSKTTPLDGVTTNYLNYKDGKDYGQVIAGQSAQLSGLTANGGTEATGSITSGTIERRRYDYNGAQRKLGVKITYSNDNKEKVVKFTGTGKPEDTMQVFSVNASDLSSDGFSGTGFEFENIPVIGTYKDKNGHDRNIYASVVINVNGDADFHNGWSFKWNGTEIGEGYYNNSAHRDAYDDAASSIMWNFYNANKVTIRGGMIKANHATWLSGDTTVTEKSSEPGMGNYITSDDPAAAMIGSIMVPQGSFDDHVTTNGRVWVGKDFMMNSPYPIHTKNGAEWKPSNVTNNEKTPTASIIAMDMERHNFGWSASINTACSVIAWNKVNQSGDSLGGTSWGIYKTADAAAKPVTQFGQGLIRYVTDNDMSTDQASDVPGRIEINNLEPEANYYIRELDTHNSQYELNPYIYKIEAGPNKGNPYTAIAAVYKVTDATTGAVDEVTGSDEAKQLLDGKIVNKSSGFDIEWGKTESGKTEGLKGSEWILSQGENQWVVRDDGTPINLITIQQNGTTVENITQAQGTMITGLKAVIDPAEPNQKVTWSTAPEGYVDVVQMEDGTTSVLLRGRPDDGQVVLTATAADGTTNSVTITITAPPVKSIAITPASATIQVGGERQLTAVVKDTNDQELDVTPTWSVQEGKGDVIAIAQDGTVTGKTAGSAKIYASFGGQQEEADVTVEALPTPKTRINALIPNEWANPYLYVWMPKHLGQWPGTAMIKDTNRGAQGNAYWYYLDVETTDGFSFIISNNGNPQTQTSDKEIPAGGGTYDVKDVWTGKTPQIQKVNTRNGAPRRSRAMKATAETTDTSNAATQTSWTPVNTTDWTVANGKEKNDDNPATGKFKVSGLKPGKYTLKENKAPEDYFVNPTEYEITIAEDGKVTWDPEPKKDSNGLHWIEDVPTEFSWTKVDAGYSADDTDAKRNPIAGSKWSLEKFTAPATAGANGTYADIAEIKDCTSDDQSGCAIDKDSEAGKFKLTGLALGKYRLVETEAPTGYTKLDTYYYFELNTMDPDPENSLPVKWTEGTETSWDKQTGSYNGTATGSSPSESEKAVEVNAAPNYRSPGDVYWGKVSSELNSENKHVYLGGSAWEVTYTPATGDSGQPVTVQITDCVKSGDKETGTCAPAGAPAWAYDAYQAEGRIGFSDLPWGTYTMKETKAPDGYNVDSETVYTFTVDATHRENVQIYKKGNPNSPILTPSNPTDQEGNPLPDYPNQVISNEPGVVLPATGGEGNTRIVLFGFALIAISMLGCGVAMRKRI